MLSLSDIRRSRYFQRGSHSYQDVDDRIMRARSLEAVYAGPLVRLADPKADAVNDGSLGDFREEEHRKPR